MPSFFRNIVSSFSPPGRPPMPKCPTNGSEVTKVSGTLSCSFALRSWWEVLHKNSYARYQRFQCTTSLKGRRLGLAIGRSGRSAG